MKSITNRILSISTVLVAIAVGSGCAGSKNPETIVYHGGSNNSSGTPPQAPTTSTAGDETITPPPTPTDSDGDGVVDSDGDGVVDTDDACPGTASGSTVDSRGCLVVTTTADSDGDGVIDTDDDCPGTASGTTVDSRGCPVVTTPSVDSDGDGVPDSVDRCPGTLPRTAVNAYGCPRHECAGNNFAYVSQHDGIDNVYAEMGGDAIPITNNTSTGISYDHLAAFPNDGPAVAFDEITFAGLIGFVRTKIVMDPDHPLYLSDDMTTWTREYVWNADASKAAFLKHKNTRGGWQSEIRVIRSLDDTTPQVIDLGTTRNPWTFGKITWWGDRLIYQADETVTDAFGRGHIEQHFYVVDFHGTAAPTVKKLFHDYSVRGESTWDDQFGFDPAVSPDGSWLAYSEPRTDGGKSLVTCPLQEATDPLSGTRFYQCASDPSSSFIRHALEVAVTGSNTSPAWSRDGQWIYFSTIRSGHAGNSKIYRIHPNGTGEEQLTDGPDNDTSPVALPAPRSCSTH